MTWYNETQLHSPTASTVTTISSPQHADITDDLSNGPDSTTNQHTVQWEQYVNNTLMDMQQRIDSVSKCFQLYWVQFANT